MNEQKTEKISIKERITDWLMKRILVIFNNGKLDCAACGASIKYFSIKIPMKYNKKHLHCPCCGRPMKGRM